MPIVLYVHHYANNVRNFAKHSDRVIEICRGRLVSTIKVILLILHSKSASRILYKIYTTHW